MLAAAGLAALAGCDGGTRGSGANSDNGGSEREPFVSIERSRGSRTAQPPADQPNGGQSSQEDVQPEQGQADIALGTFDADRTAVPEGEQPGGRLPADGDRSAYISAVSLFPGVARIDPNIANPYEGDPEAVAAGQRHFQAFNCAGCHAPLGGGGMGPPLSDDAWIHGSEPAQIYLSILHGRAEGMPAWGSMLPRRAIWELVSYVQSLSEIDNYATHNGFEPNPARRWEGAASGQQGSAGQGDGP